jgi:hypothetical protein
MLPLPSSSASSIMSSISSSVGFWPENDSGRCYKVVVFGGHEEFIYLLGNGTENKGHKYFFNQNFYVFIFPKCLHAQNAIMYIGRLFDDLV